MKRTVKKATLASVFALALAATAVGTANVNVAFATGAVETSDKIAMVDGAALRLESEEPEVDFGLRFKTQVNKAWYDELVEAGKTPQVYTVLLPTDMLTAELTAATAEIVTADIDEAKGYELGENYVFCTVLTSIPETAYGTEISARSYIVVDDQTTLYSPLFEETNASVARSVVAVADKALTEDAQAYAAVEKYLIKGVDVSDNRYLALDGESNVSAKLLFENGTSEAVQTLLNEKYEFTYSSNAEETVTIAEDGTLTAKAVGSAQITVKNETLNVEKTITVNVYEKATPVYGVMSFDNLDMVDDVTNFKAKDLKLVNDNGETKISFYHDGTTAKEIGFTLAKPAWIENFDTITIDVTLAEETDSVGGKTWLLYGFTTTGTDEDGNPRLISAEGTGIALTETGDSTTYTLGVTGTKYKWALEEDTYSVYMSRRQNYDGQSATFVIGAPKFGINDIAYTSGDAAINLYEKFHTEAGKASFTFTPTGGTASQIDNPEAYAGTADGVITATISMDGYAAGTVTANYDYTKLVAYGTVVDFTDIDESTINPFFTSDTWVNEDAGSFSIVDYNNQKAIALTITNTDTELSGAVGTGITINVSSDYGKFTSFTATWILAEENDTDNKAKWNVYGKTAVELINQGDCYEFTYPTASYLKSNKLRLYVDERNANIKASETFYITDIKLGFADLTVGDAFDWATYGLSVSELSNVTFNGEAVDASTFTTAEAGALSFTVNKAGYAPATFTINVVAAS